MSPLAALTPELGTRAATHTSSVSQALASLMERLGHWDTPAPSPADAAAYEFSRLEAEVVRLNSERAQIAAENQLLLELIGRSAPAGAGRLLRCLVPEPAEGFAALIDTTSPVPTTLAMRGSQIDPAGGISIPDQTLKQLRHDPVLVRRFVARPTGAGTMTIAIQDPESRQKQESLEQLTSNELFLVPIREDDRLAGILASTSLWPAGLRRIEQAETLSRVSQTIVRRFLQERELEQHQRELSLATDMLRLKSITDRSLDEPLEALGEFTAGLCAAVEMDRAALFLVSRRTGDVARPVIEAGTPWPLPLAEDWRTLEAEIAAGGEALEQGQWMDKAELQKLGVNTLWGHAAVWPLQSAGKRLGTLVLSRRNPELLPDRNRQLIEWGADLLAQTLRRIYRDASIRRQARHDGLTDLANRRTFDSLLAIEVDRVHLGITEECSLLLADLDRFKSINDQHGHQAGDEVLRETAQLLREQVGRMRVGERSLLARYGGEELAILLPGVGTAGALRVAEEIRAAVERMAIVCGDKQLKVTVSIGVATCPLHGLGAADLVAAADAALYRAKSEGRNRVCRPAT